MAGPLFTSYLSQSWDVHHLERKAAKTTPKANDCHPDSIPSNNKSSLEGGLGYAQLCLVNV
jgi:hypothetical protein